MIRRSNPWPAFVDLFAALLIASFAGFVMVAISYHEEVNKYRKQNDALRKIRSEADRIIDQIKLALNSNSNMKGMIRQCGDDTCIDLLIHFDRNNDVISDPREIKSLDMTARILKQALEGLPTPDRNDINLVIEGHTDSEQPKNMTDQRTAYLFNWNLSSTRATSVLYEFKKLGLSPPEFAIVAIGYADTVPLCNDNNQDNECAALNRRTTIRLHPDTKRIEGRLNGSTIISNKKD